MAEPGSFRGRVHSPNGGAWPLIPHPAPPAATGLNEKIHHDDPVLRTKVSVRRSKTTAPEEQAGAGKREKKSRERPEEQELICKRSIKRSIKRLLQPPAPPTAQRSAERLRVAAAWAWRARTQSNSGSS